MWKRGRVLDSGTYSTSRSSAGAVGTRGASPKAVGRELEHRQGAGQGRSIGHGCAGEPTTVAPGMPAATSGGTHSSAWASAYVLVSPW